MAITTYRHLTFHDACDHVLDQVVGGDGSPRNRRQAVRAVQEAYNEIADRRKWRYFYRPLTIQTVASQTSSTITYTASSRSVTLAAGTWPTEATKYALYIDGKRYSVATRSSSTVLVLDEKDAPVADIAAGTSYTLARDTYELPDNCRALLELYDAQAPGRLVSRVDPGDIIWRQRVQRGAGQPLCYSVYRSERFSGALAVHFAPSPNSALIYQGLGLFDPLELKILDYQLGSVATTADSDQVTGTSTAFTSDMNGAVIRFSPTGVTKIPTDLQGEIDKNRLEPYAMQRVIKTRDAAATLTLEQAADQTLTGSGYRISSRIDIEAGAMRNAFLRCCEARFATQDRQRSEEREARYEKALILALHADQRVVDSTPSGWAPTSLAEVAGNINLTTGGVQP